MNNQNYNPNFNPNFNQNSTDNNPYNTNSGYQAPPVYNNNPTPTPNMQYNGNNGGKPPKNGNSNNKTLYILIGVAAAVVLLLAIVLIVVLSSGRNKPSNNYSYDSNTTSYQAPTEAQTQPTTLPETTTLPVTQAPTQPAVDHRINVSNDGAPSDRYLTQGELTALNTFISNLAETEFLSYGYMNNNSDAIINFAILHAYLNGNNTCKVNGEAVSISGDSVYKYIYRFFDTDISLRSTDMADYNSATNMFYTSRSRLDAKIVHSNSGFGRIYSFAVIDSCTKFFDGAYGVTFKIYSVSSPVSDAYYGYYQYQAQSLGGVRQIATGRATVMPANTGVLSDSMKMQIVDYTVSY